MPETVILQDVRCASCRRRVGVSGVSKWGVFCDGFCAGDLPAAEHEMRDAVIEALMRDTDMPLSNIGRIFGVARQRMYQIRDYRDVRNAAIE